MPLYEYECDVCGHRFEKIQKFSHPLEHKCPTCAGHVHKLQSSPAIQFKGSGFYITDYAKRITAAAKASGRRPEVRSPRQREIGEVRKVGEVRQIRRQRRRHELVGPSRHRQGSATEGSARQVDGSSGASSTSGPATKASSST
jgi:putative FmdB family regulatory protein